MSIRSALVGVDLGACDFEVTTRPLLSFAAALGETAPAVFDDAAADFAAMPQFCVVPEWPWASAAERTGRLGLTPEEARRALHMGQDSTFHRPVRPGMRLRVSGQLVAVRASKAGAITVSRIETSDASTGDRCVTTYSSALFRGVPLEGEPRSIERTATAPSAAGVDDARADVAEIAIPREFGHVYTECTGIWNPIHTERRVALAMGLPDIVLHGTATWAMAGRELSRLYGGGQAALRRLAGSFRAMVIPGTAIRIEHRLLPAASATVRFTVFNAAGETAVADGIAEFSSPTN
jgi:acyl dehydratase